jgi:hypothetical protein
MTGTSYRERHLFAFAFMPVLFHFAGLMATMAIVTDEGGGGGRIEGITRLAGHDCVSCSVWRHISVARESWPGNTVESLTGIHDCVPGIVSRHKYSSPLNQVHSPHP